MFTNLMRLNRKPLSRQISEGLGALKSTSSPPVGPSTTGGTPPLHHTAWLQGAILSVHTQDLA